MQILFIRLFSIGIRKNVKFKSLLYNTIQKKETSTHNKKFYVNIQYKTWIKIDFFSLNISVYFSIYNIYSWISPPYNLERNSKNFVSASLNRNYLFIYYWG